MNVPLGIAAIVAGTAIALAIAFVAWHRVPAFVGYASTAIAGVLVGTGALLVQEEASRLEWGVALLVLAILTPMHARLLFGRPNGRT